MKAGTAPVLAATCHSRVSDRPKLEPIDDSDRNNGIVIELVRVDDRARYDEQVRTSSIRELHDGVNASAERVRSGAGEDLVVLVRRRDDLPGSQQL